MTSVSVIDNLLSSPSKWGHDHHSGLVEFDEPGATDLETIILRIVKDDPFASISEMKREVSKMDRVPQGGWWRIFCILKKQKLLTKRSRFKFIRSRW